MQSDVFRGSEIPTLGVELELQLVDARSMALTGAIDRILEGVPAGLHPSIKPEFYNCCVEISTDVCRDVDEAGRDLSAKLDATSRAARRHGIELAWGGTHPFSHWKDQPIVPTQRYLELAGEYRETLCRQLTFGLHVHVGVRDGDSAIRACNRIWEHLPALLALSANSPFWCGRPTGLMSHRVEVMGASPTGGLPPRLPGWGDYTRLIDGLAATGIIRSAKDLWWDVRPNADYGTVEVRICDMPRDLRSVLGISALIQCLVTSLAHDADAEACLDDRGAIIVRQNRWRAARYGLDAELINPRTGVADVARDSIADLARRLAGEAERLGCSAQLSLVQEMATEKTGAEDQIETFRQAGDLTEVARRMTTWPAPHASEYAPLIGMFTEDDRPGSVPSLPGLAPSVGP